MTTFPLLIAGPLTQTWRVTGGGSEGGLGGLILTDLLLDGGTGDVLVSLDGTNFAPPAYPHVLRADSYLRLALTDTPAGVTLAGTYDHTGPSSGGTGTLDVTGSRELSVIYPNGADRVRITATGGASSLTVLVRSLSAQGYQGDGGGLVAQAGQTVVGVLPRWTGALSLQVYGEGTVNVSRSSPSGTPAATETLTVSSSVTPLSLTIPSGATAAILQLSTSTQISTDGGATYQTIYPGGWFFVPEGLLTQVRLRRNSSTSTVTATYA